MRLLLPLLLLLPLAATAQTITGGTIAGGTFGTTGGGGGEWATGSCTDGVDCLCDALAGDPDLVFCEDFENAAYNNGGAGWIAEYDSADVNCWENGIPGGTFLEGDSVSEPLACINMVQEGACDVTGQTGCVFDGNQGLGNAWNTGETGGIYGDTGLSRSVRNFGITSVAKLSTNYQRNGPGFKYWEWGNGRQSIHQGQDTCSGSNNNLASEDPGNKGDACGDRKSWDTKLFYFPNSLPSQSYTATYGSIWDDGFTLYIRPFEARFENGVMNWPLNTWACWKTKVTGYGTSNMRIEQWFQGPTDLVETKVIDISGIDASQLSEDAGNALSRVKPNNYYNGGDGSSSGYCTDGGGNPLGCARAYRYEDNMVLMENDPLTCSQIGFTGGA